MDDDTLTYPTPGSKIKIVKIEGLGTRVFIDGKEIKYVRDIRFNHKVGGIPTLKLEVICSEVFIETDGVETLIEEIRPEQIQARATGYNPRPPADSKPPPPPPPPAERPWPKPVDIREAAPVEPPPPPPPSTVPTPPPPSTPMPSPRRIRDGDTGPYCPECGSSFKLIPSGFFARASVHCINPECTNYYSNYFWPPSKLTGSPSGRKLGSIIPVD